MEEREIEERYDEWDEDEANADLTLDIVAKASKRARQEEQVMALSPETREFFAREDEEKVLNVGKKKEKKVDKRGKTYVVHGKGTMSDPVRIFPLADEDALEREKVDRNGSDTEKSATKKKKKSKSKRSKKQSPSEAPTTTEAVEQQESLEVRKLLRPPRYFDPPEDREETCFVCGETGHYAANCSAGRLRRPCYVCGEVSHEGKDCPQKAECYVCGLPGHIAKSCPQKGQFRTRVCLHCGDNGHDVSTCKKDYDLEDLKAVQCYVCKRFGHLCCVDGLNSFPVQVSCYNCGGTGHTGMGCAKSRRVSSSGRASSSDALAKCFKCGGEGHFARGCNQTRWPGPWEDDEEEPFPRSENNARTRFPIRGNKNNTRNASGELSSKKQRNFGGKQPWRDNC